MARNAAVAAAAAARQVIKCKLRSSPSAFFGYGSGYGYGYHLLHHIKPNLSFQYKQTTFESPLSRNFHRHHRDIHTPPVPSRVTLIKSVQEFKTAFQKVQDESLPAIFYFTAVWCGPCRIMSPVFEEISKEYPHVTFYKIDIDEEGLGDQVSELKIMAVPTFHLFKDGKLVEEMVGADRGRLTTTIGQHYK